MEYNPFQQARVGELLLPLYGNGDAVPVLDDRLARSFQGTFALQCNNVKELCRKLGDHATIVAILEPTIDFQGNTKQNVIVTVLKTDKDWFARPCRPGIWRVYDKSHACAFEHRPVSALVRGAPEVDAAMQAVVTKMQAINKIRLSMGGLLGAHILALEKAMSLEDSMHLVVNLAPLETVWVPPSLRNNLRIVFHSELAKLQPLEKALTETRQALASVCAGIIPKLDVLFKEEISELSRKASELTLQQQALSKDLVANTAKLNAATEAIEYTRNVQHTLHTLAKVPCPPSPEANDDTDDD